MKTYYSDDSVTIYHGETLDILPQLGSIDAIVTDPPYSSGGAFRGDRMQKTLAKYVSSDSSAQNTLQQFSGDNRDQRSFLVWCTLWMTAARNIAVDGAPIITFTDWRQLPTITDALQCGGWIWRNIGTWWKPGIRMQSGAFSGSAEYVCFGTNGALKAHRGAPRRTAKRV